MRFRGLYHLAMGAWLGVALFFTFWVTLAVFGTLGFNQAGPLLNALFPQYYAFTTVAGVIAVAAGMSMPGPSRWAWGLPLASLVLQGYAWGWLFPQVQRAVGTPGFGRLHGMSLGIDCITILLIAVALAISVSGRQTGLRT